ncbi:hypothetical protein L7F22_062472 [Adiantum nelumboides]|nr:hypothetical protein [Adiantum nelumboides]
MQEKGAFIVSIWTCGEEQTLVTDDIRRDWDPLWIEINNEFEEELASKSNLGSLCNKMFYVWEGNHRTVAWQAVINEKFSMVKEKHYRVLCTIIDPTKVSEIALLTSLQRMNFMNMHSMVSTHLRDELVNCTNICGANHDAYLRALPEKDQKIISDVRKKHTKGSEPWYPLTRKYLGRLLYDVQMSKEFHMRIEQSRPGLCGNDLKKEEKKLTNELAHKYGERIGKILNIIDPSLGKTWLDRIWALKWGPESWASLEKLNLIAVQNASIENKILWVSLLEADKITRSGYGLKRGDQFFRIWLRREGMLHRILDRANRLLVDYVDVLGGVIVPPHCTLTMYFMEVKIEARDNLFPLETSLESKFKDVDAHALKKIDALQMAAQRVVYRYFTHLQLEGHIIAIPVMAKQWTIITIEEGCMWPPSMREFSKWELDHCPWWVDMVHGRVLAREREMYEAHKKGQEHSNHPSSDDAQQQTIADGHSLAPRENIASERILDDSMPLHERDGRMTQKKVFSYIYVSEISIGLLSSSGDGRCMAVAGDYIAIANDFRVGKRNPIWMPIHEHMLKARATDLQYNKCGRVVAWAADFIFLDLPFGGLHHPSGSQPPWDVCSEEHVRSGIHLALSTLADLGWLLIMASSAGDTVRWVERLCGGVDLYIHHRIVVLHHDSYGYIECYGEQVQCEFSTLFLVHRRGVHPPCFITESMPMFRLLGMKPTDSVMRHYLPDNARAFSSLGEPWRGALQRSHSLLACFVVMLCRQKGICLEFGCGTAPILAACLATGRACASIDSDEDIIVSCVQSMYLSKKKHREETSTSMDMDDEGDRYVGGNPFDDL